MPGLSSRHSFGRNLRFTLGQRKSVTTVASPMSNSNRFWFKISHGPLHNLGTPPMTMGFRVGDPAWPEQLKPGDKVKFHADAIGGAFTATSIEIAN